jgi:hypothetical protein
LRTSAGLLLTLCFFSLPAIGQRQFYLGALGGLATLSGDGRDVVTASSAATSVLDPKNGPAATIFFGTHLFNYVSIQGNYIWNDNDVTLVSALSSPAGASFYRQPELSTQDAFIGDVLVYFRKRGGRIRPYLSQGGGLVHISSRFTGTTLARGTLMLPPAHSASTAAASRTSVGLDVCLSRGWYFRYTFGETISHNPISAQLSPPGTRLLKNFQNVFGIYRTF